MGECEWKRSKLKVSVTTMSNRPFLYKKRTQIYQSPTKITPQIATAKNTLLITCQWTVFAPLSNLNPNRLAQFWRDRESIKSGWKNSCLRYASATMQRGRSYTHHKNRNYKGIKAFIQKTRLSFNSHVSLVMHLFHGKIRL